MKKNYLNPFIPIVKEKDHFIFGVGGQFSGSNNDKFKLTSKQILMLDELINGKSFYPNELEEVFGNELYNYFAKKSILIPFKQDTKELFSRTDAFYKTNRMGDMRKILSKKCVLILGCGGIGTHVSWNLVTSGIGEIILVDFDRIELSNLNRQLLYDIDDVGGLKISVLESKLKKINPDIKIKSLDKKISSKYDLEEICKTYNPDLIVKSLDSPEEFPMFLDEVCKENKISYVAGSAASTHVIIGPTYIPGKNHGYTEFFFNKENIAKHVSGLSPSLSIIMYDMSSEISIEAFKVLTGVGSIKYNNLMIFKNVISGDYMEIVPRYIEIEEDIIKKKSINKNNIIVSLIFLLLTLVTDYNFLMWIGALYACISPIIVFSIKKNVLRLSFVNMAWYMMISIFISVINNKLFLDMTIIQALSSILTIFILYSFILILTCVITLILFSIKSSFLMRWNNEQ